MKFIHVFNIIIVLFFQKIVFAQSVQKNFGIGVMIGHPVAVTVQHNISKNNSVAGGFSFSLSDYTLVYADYHYHVSHLIKNKNPFSVETNPYVGFGGLLVLTNKDRSSDDLYLGKKSGHLGLGVRIPFGFEVLPQTLPIRFFAEIVPGMSLTPTMGAFFHLGLGIRYYF